MDMGQFASIPAIVMICMLLAQVLKLTALDNKWLPVICGVFGGILGVSAIWIMPEFPANDVFTAAAVGIASGLGATGAHQIFKQLKK